MNTTRIATHIAATLLALTIATTTRAQAPDPHNAPLPAALTRARTLFLGNAGDQENADCLRAYNDLYQGLAALGRFTMLDDPNKSDLVLEMHYEIAIGQSAGGNQPFTLNGNSIRQFRLVFLDPHSHAVLWSLTERTNYAVRQKNRNANLDETVATLLNDFNLLVSAIPPNNKSVVTHD